MVRESCCGKIVSIKDGRFFCEVCNQFFSYKSKSYKDKHPNRIQISGNGDEE